MWKTFYDEMQNEDIVRMISEKESNQVHLVKYEEVNSFTSSFSSLHKLSVIVYGEFIITD